MRNSSNLIFGAAIVLALIGCSAEKMMKRMTPADADARARAYLVLLAEDRTAEAEARLLPGLASAEAHASYEQIASVLDGERFDSMHVIGVAVNTINGVRHANLSYEIRSRVGWTIANVATIDSLDTWFVEGVSARRIARPLEEVSAFTLRGQSPKQYVFLTLTVICAIISVGTAVFIAARPEMPSRWRWVLFSLVGVCTFSMNWTTAEMTFRAVSVQLFAAGFIKAAPAAPWTIAFAIPIGALLALRRHRDWRHSVDAAPTTSVENAAIEPLPPAGPALSL